MKWVKKLFRAAPKPPEHRTTMVEVLKELWDIDDRKPHEEAPRHVNHDIYHVGPRDKAVPPRDSRGRQRYRRSR